MALLPSDPKQQKAVGVIAFSLVALYGYWSFLHTPRVEELATQQETLERLEGQNSTARMQNLRGGVTELEERALEYERHVRRLEQLIPAREEVAPLINTITLEARRLGITVVDISPLPDEAGVHYTRHAYSLEIVGDYHDVGQFMASIASGTRIITPVSVTISPYDVGQGDLGDYEAPILVIFEIQTFILPDPNSAPAPELGGEGAAGEQE